VIGDELELNVRDQPRQIGIGVGNPQVFVGHLDGGVAVGTDRDDGCTAGLCLLGVFSVFSSSCPVKIANTGVWGVTSASGPCFSSPEAKPSACS